MRIIDWFDQGVRYFPGSTAFIEGDDRVSYAEASEASHRVAAAMKRDGLGKGTRIAVLAPNSIAAFIAWLGLQRAETVWLPLNPRNPVAVNRDLLQRFGANGLFIDPALAAEGAAIGEGLALRATIRLDQWDGWLAPNDAQVDPGEEQPGDLLAIFPTGGTTGAPKGVLMAHRAVETFAANFYAHFDYGGESRHLVVAPMTHTAGLLAALHFARGGTNVVLDRVDPIAILDAIEQERITHLFLPPTVVYLLLAHPGVETRDFSSLRHFFVGAAPISLEKLRRAIDVFGPVMTEAFGQSEAPAAICCKAPCDYKGADGTINLKRLGSVGRPAVFNHVRLLLDDGAEAARGEPGEICVRGSLVNPAYLDPADGPIVNEDGWRHTGDVGVMDADGFVTIVDRKRDMIITGGFNVYPNEVEQALMMNPAVQDCAVIGVPDSKWGEAVKAVVLLRPGGEADADALIALVRDRLGGVKAPKSIDFVDALPRSPVGKVMKAELRRMYWKGQTRAVA